MKKLYLLIFSLFGLTTQAQLIIDNTTQSPAELVQSSLVGNGVIAFNIKFNGTTGDANIPRDQAGRFSTNFNQTNLGLNQGLILSTGDAKVALGPNNEGGKYILSTSPTTGDLDLAKVIDPINPDVNKIENSAILEFDFVATGPTLKFDFIFASEEYPEYVGHGFNDVFGFFLSGPGIIGDFSNAARNIALIPSTTTPVSIDNVNNGDDNIGPCDNCNYYYNNLTTGQNPTTHNPAFSTQYDGFTKNLSATAQLICGQTYHIKLAIGNVGDSQLDSAVFLKDFQIPALELLANGDDDYVGCDGDSVIIDSGVSPAGNTFVWTHEGVLIVGANGPTITVSEGGTYELNVYNANGCLLGHDEVEVTMFEFETNEPVDITICDNGTGPYLYNLDQTNYMLTPINATEQDFYSFYYFEDNGGSLGAAIDPTVPYLSSGAAEIIWVGIAFEDPAGGSCQKLTSFTLNTATGFLGNLAYSSPTYCSDIATDQLPLAGLPSGGQFTSTPVGLDLDPTTGAITPSTSTPNTYTVNYDIPTTGSCPPFHDDTQVTINFCVTCSTTASNSGPICSGGNFNLATTTVAGATYSWSGPSYTASGQNQTGVTAPTTPGSYIYTVVANVGGIDCSTSTTTLVVEPLPTASISGTTAICSGAATTIAFSGTANATVTYTINGGATQTIVLSATGTASLPTGNLTANTTYALVSVTNTTTSCSQAQAGSAVVTVNPLPIVSIAGTTSICSGTGTNITFTGTANATVNYTVNGGANQTIVLSAGGTAILPTGNLTANTTYALVNVINTTTTCSQSQTGSAVITVNPLPTATITGAITICSGTGTNISFNGTANATVTYTINGGANQTIVLSAGGTASLPTGNLTANTTYALVSVNNTATTCSQSQTGSVLVTVNPLPTASISGTTTICSGGASSITFSGTANATVTYTINGGTNQTIVLSGTGTASLPTGNLTANTNYALVNAFYAAGLCLNPQTGSAVVTVNPLPTATIAGATTICSGTGTNITFSGTANATVTYTINGGANQTIVLSAGGTASLPTGNLTANTTYALVSVTNTVTTCSRSQTGSVLVTVNPLPTASISGTTTICSGGASSITFSGTANATVTYTINGGANQTIVLSATGAASLPTGNLTANTTYALVNASYAAGLCLNPQTGSAVVTVNPLPTASIAGTTTVCLGTGANITFTGTANATVTYTVNGGANQTLLLNTTGTGTLSTGNLSATATYTLVSVGNTVCSNPQTGSAVVTVVKVPEVDLTDGPICVDQNGNSLGSHTFTTGLTTTDYDFEWKDSAGNVVGTQESLVVTIPGTYNVVITMKASPFCTSVAIFGQATTSTPPVSFVAVPTSYFNENPSITVAVSPAGQYEYQIDNGGFQSSNVFTDVSSGAHQIQVRNECGILGPKTVTIIDYPKFFTPNGDGYHDTWNISALNGQANAKIYIFDRFGKLLKEILPSSEGWNGTFNGLDLPSADYWFVTYYKEDNQNREFKSHFALKR